MNNPAKLAIYGKQDEEKQSKITTQYVLDITMRKQTQITYIRHEPSYKQLEVKTNEHRFYAENVTDITKRNSERRHIIGQHKKLKWLESKSPSFQLISQYVKNGWHKCYQKSNNKS